MSKKILLINDLPGYGKVALSAMIPVLSHMKYDIYNLPTAIVSNTLDYGKFNLLDTTEYMKNTLKVWEQLEFRFDAISTGFIVSKEQTELISEFCREKSGSGTVIFTDPIMGDNGKLYNGRTQETVTLMRELISAADYITPNYTEAAYLANATYKEEGATEEEFRTIIDTLRDMGAKSVVITSAGIKDSGGKSVIGYDHKEQSFFRIDYEEVPVRFPGTGDIFSAVLIGSIMDGKNLREAARQATQVVSKMIRINSDNADNYKGIPIETCLEVMKG